MTTASEAETAHFTQIIDEQIQYFSGHKLIGKLGTIDLLQSHVELSCVDSPSLYRNFSAQVLDNPRTDSLTVMVDRPTVEDMVEEYTHPKGLNADDVQRLYVGTGIANLLIASSFIRPGSHKKAAKFVEALAEPQGFYARTMDSEIFDSIQADETARDIATEGYSQIAKVNATRLTTAMFIEAQPDPKQMRTRFERTFQEELAEVFKGKQTYIANLGLFNVPEQAAKDMYTNSVEVLLGLAFPMRTAEVKDLVKKLG